MSNFEKAHSNFERLNRTVEQYSGADFSKAQEMVKRFEGGYSTLEWDRGNYICDAGSKGYSAKGTSQKGKTAKDFSCDTGTLKFVGTNWGISAPVLAEYLGRTPTVSDMKNLSYETAKSIYKKNFWDRMNGDSIKDQNIANMMYDSMVQSEGMTKRILNNTLGELNIGEVKSLGAGDTTTKINNAPQKKFFETFKKNRIEEYKKFGQDWGVARTLQILYDEAVKFTKRNWKALTVSFIGIGAMAYLGIRYRAQIAKAIFK